MADLESKNSPVETILEFVFYGLFAPRNYEPSWLFRNEILHPREVKEVNEIKINEAEVFYSTDIISYHVTYDSMSIKTNSSLTYDSLLAICKRIVNVLRADLKSDLSFNIRYHFKNPKDNNARKQMDKLVVNSFWNGVIDDPLLNGASITKSVQKKEFYWSTDINVSMCRRSSAKGQLIHVFFRNSLNLEATALKTQKKRNKAYNWQIYPIR